MVKWIEITGNGLFPLDFQFNKGVVGRDQMILAPAAMGTATVTIGYLDQTPAIVDLQGGGALLVDEQILFQGNTDILLFATIATYSADFSIGIATVTNR